MICGVHALLGAAVGKALKRKEQAFLAGLFSHLLADLLPHRDLSPAAETLFAITVTAALGASQGWNSPAFWGAVGGVLPDVENVVFYLRGGGKHFFPTHSGRHGAAVDELLSQAGLALLCLAFLFGQDKSLPDKK